MVERLSKTMTVEQFDNGYWYAVEIKAFASELGIKAVSRLRKDELEGLIRQYLRTGKIESPERKNLSKRGPADSSLDPDLVVRNYADTKATKDFIMSEAKKLVPDLKRKSGAQYRLNRWREEQIEAGKRITYRDIVSKFIELNQFEGKFKQAPTGRYINFLSDFLSRERGSSRKQAMEAWRRLKKLEIPKNFESWKKYQSESEK